MKRAAKKKIPRFSCEDEERKFWDSHDSSDFIDWKNANQVVLSKLKPTVRSISIRLPEIMIEEIKFLANRRDVPYQSLMKMFLAERVEEELHKV